MTSLTSVVTNINLIQEVNTTPATTARAENDGNLIQVINNLCISTTLTHDTEVITPHQTDSNYWPLLKRTFYFDLYRDINNISNIKSEVVSDAMICLPCNEEEEDFGLVDTDSDEGDSEEGDERDSIDDFYLRWYRSPW